MGYDSYIRVSRVGQREGYQSPEEQRRLIADVATRAGVVLDLEVVEEDVSGAIAAAERGLERLLDRAERGESEGIIVAFQDRLSRGSLIETAQVWERLGAAGARLLTGDGLDSAAPGQELLFNIRAAIARDQWQRYRDGWSRTVRGRVAEGIHHCATPPLGYRFGERKKLERDPETAPVLEELFRRRIAGQSHADLARWLKSVGHEMSTQGTRKILRNRVYLGEARYGETVTEGAHEPLVSQLDFDRAGAAKNRGVRWSRTGVAAGRTYTLGLARCAECGRRLASSIARDRVYLTCLSPHHAPVNISAAALDAHVTETVLTWQTRARGLEFERPRGDLDAARAAFDAREYDLDLFLGNLASISILGQARWNEQAARYAAAVDEARAALVAAAEAAATGETWTRLQERWDASDTEGRRALLAQLVESIEVRPVNGRRGVPTSERTSVIRRGSASDV
jgi:Resolvase, N terminal domain/Recombinase